MPRVKYVMGEYWEEHESLNNKVCIKPVDPSQQLGQYTHDNSHHNLDLATSCPSQPGPALPDANSINRTKAAQDVSVPQFFNMNKEISKRLHFISHNY